jgi:hypothetical protein
MPGIVLPSNGIQIVTPLSPPLHNFFVAADNETHICPRWLTVRLILNLGHGRSKISCLCKNMRLSAHPHFVPFAAFDSQDTDQSLSMAQLNRHRSYGGSSSIDISMDDFELHSDSSAKNESEGAVVQTIERPAISMLKRVSHSLFHRHELDRALERPHIAGRLILRL